MGTSGSEAEARAIAVSVDDDALTIDLADGRRLSVPLDWFPRLLEATQAQRENWRLSGEGRGIHWPDVDEDLSVAGLLRGAKAPGSKRAI